MLRNIFPAKFFCRNDTNQNAVLVFFQESSDFPTVFNLDFTIWHTKALLTAIQ